NEETKAVQLTEEAKEKGLSPEISIMGKMTLTDDAIEVEAETNLPEGVDVTVAAYANPNGGYVVSQVLEKEKIEVGQNGAVNGSIPFDPSLYEARLNEPVRLVLAFSPQSVNSLHEREDEIISAYGENGEKLEGPFVKEEYKFSQDEPVYTVKADVVGPITAGEEFIIEEKSIGDPPADYGNSNV
ncbi:hypothetical protein, partial [Gracilibacillus oryzae]|uniref:hypothetical protein n=1 Tax=Gracilibacillus oryzae TaxID=1672701 RepID=UPI0018863DD2